MLKHKEDTNLKFVWWSSKRHIKPKHVKQLFGYSMNGNVTFSTSAKKICDIIRDLEGLVEPGILLEVTKTVLNETSKQKEDFGRYCYVLYVHVYLVT